MVAYTKEEFRQNVYIVVKSIPSGYVLSYGRIAVLVGRPHNSRMVGHFLSGSPEDVPAHRVVNHKGGTAPNWSHQKALLLAEGVSFKENGNVDMKKHLWRHY